MDGLSEFLPSGSDREVDPTVAVITLHDLFTDERTASPAMSQICEKSIPPNRDANLDTGGLGDYFKGVNDLASRIAATGIKRVEGDLIRDDVDGEHRNVGDLRRCALSHAKPPRFVSRSASMRVGRLSGSKWLAKPKFLTQVEAFDVVDRTGVYVVLTASS